MQITKANKANKKLRVALFGDSGNGKTHCALAMAIACGGKILVIDSEDGASHNFSEFGDFSVLQINEPTLEEYTKAIALAVDEQRKGNGFNVIVIDSLSHAWQNALTQVSAFSNTTLGWGKVTPKWDGMLHKIKQLNAHIFVTMRQKQRNEMGKWIDTYDSRENSDYEYDLILQMTGLKNGQAYATVKKCRFNTQVDKLRVGGEVVAGAPLIKFVLDWQQKNENGEQQL